MLNDEQADRFFDTMDALLFYVNERFQVVEGFTLDYDSQIGDMKASLVARELWENVEIIDEFVRENPARLPQRCLDTALGWKNALPGLYAVVRYQGGRALMMSDVGVFSVGGVTTELEEEIGKVPAYAEVVLLPFDDGIVYDGFLQAYDVDASAGEVARIQDEFEDRCARGIVSGAAEFIEVAGAHLAAKRDEELDALLAGVSREAAGGEETLPAGFHRGALAGLDALEREAAVSAELARRGSAEAGLPGALGVPGSSGGSFTVSAVGNVPSGEAAPTGAGPGPSGAAGPGASPTGAAGVVPAGDIGAGAEAAPAPAAPTPSAPAGPASARPAGERDWVDVQSDQAVNCAIASVLARGVVEVGEAYDAYRALVPDPLGFGDFDLLVRHEASFSDSYFGLWTFEGRAYLAYYILMPDYVTQTAARNGSYAGLREELEYYEGYKRELLQARAEVGPRPLSRTLLENTPLGELLRDANVARLRRFLDERIPDGQDDYTFADLAAQEFALTAIEFGSLEELYRLAQDLGLEGCSADESLLPRLVANVLNAMPSWENNGWSPQELYEQLTGRRIFYNEDGTVKKVGGDEPCPCGSGLKYRECCGR